MLDAWQRLVDDAGGDPREVYLLNYSFYIDGDAWQPIVIGCDELRDLISASPVPAYDEDGDYVLPDAWIALAQAGYQDYTGLLIDQDLARTLASQLTLETSAMRRTESTFRYPSAAQRAMMRGTIEGILREEDPIGLVASGAEVRPYEREALWLADRVHGLPDDVDPAKLLVRIRIMLQLDSLVSGVGDATWMEDKVRAIARRVATEAARPLSMQLHGEMS
jgi:hypothetical protein